MTYASAGGRKRAKDTVGHWALTVALAVELVLCLYNVGSRLPGIAHEDLASSLGYLAGYSLIPVAVIWAVTYFGFARRSAPERGVPYLLILLFFAVAVQGAALVLLRGAAADQNAQVRTAANDLEGAISSLKTSPGVKVNTRAKATGEAGELERLLKTYIANIQSDRDAYLAELRAAGVLDALKPEHLARDRTLRATCASLAAGKAIVKKYRERYHARKLELRQAIERSEMTPADRRAMLASLDRAEAHGDPGDQVWDVEDAYLDEMDATAADLQHARGRWAVQNHRLMFSNPADLQAYNQHIANLQGLAQRERDLRDAGYRQAMHGVELMRRAAQ
jgi:hypothetical protein